MNLREDMDEINHCGIAINKVLQSPWKCIHAWLALPYTNINTILSSALNVQREYFFFDGFQWLIAMVDLEKLAWILFLDLTGVLIVLMIMMMVWGCAARFFFWVEIIWRRRRRNRHGLPAKRSVIISRRGRGCVCMKEESIKTLMLKKTERGGLYVIFFKSWGPPMQFFLILIFFKYDDVYLFIQNKK